MTSTSVNAASKTSAPSAEEEGLLARWESTRQAQEWSSAAEAVRATLMAAIVNRELPPGWRLSEERLVALFKVSRTPIREALMAVAGTSLARRDERGRLRVAALTAEQILGAYTVRRSLEGLAASLAASAPTPQLIARLRELNRQCADAADHEEFDAMLLVNCDFHATIAAATGNEMLIRYTDDLLNWVKRISTTTLAEGRAPGAVKEHEEIIDAIAGREPELAERLAEEHVRRAQRVRIDMLAKAPGELSARTPK